MIAQMCKRAVTPRRLGESLVERHVESAKTKDGVSPELEEGAAFYEMVPFILILGGGPAYA